MAIDLGMGFIDELAWHCLEPAIDLVAVPAFIFEQQTVIVPAAVLRSIPLSRCRSKDRPRQTFSREISDPRIVVHLHRPAARLPEIE
jgi:hypothetical protein